MAAEPPRLNGENATVYIAMNRFRVTRGREAEFEEIWRRRDSYLDDVEGIEEFRLLRGETGKDETLFVSHSVWVSREAFTAWTESEAFTKSHRQARTPEGVLLGHPRFEGYEVVDLARS